MVSTNLPSACNILFLGEVKSGKSALIESLKNYADTDYIINRENIGNGIRPCTSNIETSTLSTNLPSHFILKEGKRIDPVALQDGTQEDYEDELNNRQKYVLERDTSTSAEVLTFNLIDTPGLNDTAQIGEKNIALIFKAMESIYSISLVVITVANTPFTEDLKDALSDYVRLLPEFNGSIVFVHTRIDYSKFHPKEELFLHSLSEKKCTLHNLIGRDSAPHLLIDNKIDSTRPVRNCITQNTLRDILIMAKSNQAVRVKAMLVSKTEKMREADAVLTRKYEVLLRRQLDTSNHHLKAQVEVQERIGELREMIAVHEQDLQTIAHNLAYHDSENLVLLHEESYEQGINILSLAEGQQSMYYPGKQRAATRGFIHHVIDHIDIQAHNVKVLQKAGGKGQVFWAVKFRRKKGHKGLFHVKIYITNKKMFAAEIEAWRSREVEIRVALKEYQTNLDIFENQNKELGAEIREMHEDLKRNSYLYSQTTLTQLNSKLFRALVDAQAIVPDLLKSAANVEKFYLDKRTMLDDSDGDFPIPVLPALESKTPTSGGSEIPDRPDNAKYSILLLGKTQSGKSTFIQFVKNYMDPHHDIDWKLIGNGVKSTTGEPGQFVTRSSLPIYNVYHSDTGAHIVFDVMRQQCDNIYDYQDVLNHKKTAMKFAPHDSSTSLGEEFDICFLDTPGINDTNYRDVEHSKRIIEAMVQIQSFNLIIIVVDARFSISKEQQVAFSYYSQVINELQGHHNNVIFVYTHSKHEHSHHSNTEQLSKMTERHRAFSCVFRSLGRMAEDSALNLKVAAEEKNVELYPFFTIDLETSKRPVRQGMIRDTLKAILQKAVLTPPTALDTSEENLERVFAIKHPDEDNCRQREKARVKNKVDQGQQQDMGSRGEFDSVLQAAAAEVEENAAVVVKTVDSQAEDRENELLYFGSVQYVESGDDDE